MNKENITPEKAFAQVGLALLLIAGISSIAQLLGSFLSGWMSGAGYGIAESPWLKWLITFLPIYAVGIPVGLFVLSRLPISEYRSSRLGAKNFFMLLCIGIFFMYTGNLIGTGLSYLLSGGTAQNALLDFAFDSSLLKIIVMVFLAPFLEELIFRKQIIDRCGRFGEKNVILFSALTFALFHMNLYQFFYAFGLGLVFAYIYTRTHRLRYPVIMHMIVNFLGSVLAPWLLSTINMDVLSDPTALSNMSEETAAEVLPGIAVYGLYIILLLGLVITGLVFLILKAKKFVFVSAAEEIPTGQRFRTIYCNVWMILFTAFCFAVCIYSLFS